MVVLRFLRHVRDTFRVLTGRDTVVRDMTLRLQNEIVHMEESSRIQRKVCEETALAQVRQIVQEMKALEKNLQEAETAAIEQVNSIANELKERLEVDFKGEEELLLKVFEDNKEVLLERILGNDASLEHTSQTSSATKDTFTSVDGSSREANNQADELPDSVKDSDSNSKME